MNAPLRRPVIGKTRAFVSKTTSQADLKAGRLTSKGGMLENTQKMAKHESAKTTKLDDRRDDEVTLDDVERISI